MDAEVLSVSIMSLLEVARFDVNLFLYFFFRMPFRVPVNRVGTNRSHFPHTQ